MYNKVRLCRICKQMEDVEKFKPIFGQNNQLPIQIFITTGVTIVEFKESPAIICSKCLRDLQTASTFRNRCLHADTFFRISNKNLELKKFSAELDEVQKPASETVFHAVKTEPINYDSDHFVDEDFNTQDTENIHDKSLSDENEGFEAKSLHNIKTETTEIQSTIKEPRIRKKKVVKRCHYCMKTFKTLKELNEHKIIKHELTGFICDICNKSYPTKRKIMVHLINTHLRQLKRIEEEKLFGPKLFFCPTCGKGCNSKRSLVVHEIIHNVTKPDDYYYCDHCGNKFKNKPHLKLHLIKRHIQNIKISVQNLCPEKSWTSKQQLERHTKIYHHNIKEFKCEWCGKEFGYKSKLIAHTRIHTGEQPFKCEVCNAKYTHETDFRRHTYTHTGQSKKYKCESCQKAYCRKSILNKHMLRCVQFHSV